MKRLTLFAVLAASLLAWAAPVFAQIPGGTPWRTCMRYGGRDSTVMHTGSSSLYYLDIYSMTMARFKGDSVYFATRDTSNTTPWSAIVRFRLIDERDFTNVASFGDSLWVPWAPRLKLSVPTGDSLAAVRIDTTATGYASYPTTYPVDATLPAPADSVSGTMAVPGFGEFEVFFNKYNRHFSIPINLPFDASPGRLWVRIRPGGHNDSKMTYYFRCILKGVR